MSEKSAATIYNLMQKAEKNDSYHARRKLEAITKIQTVPALERRLEHGRITIHVTK